MKQSPVEGRQKETKGDKPGNHDKTKSREGRQRETNLEITTKQDPVEGDKPENHEGTRSSRRETKGDKPGNHAFCFAGVSWQCRKRG